MTRPGTKELGTKELGTKEPCTKELGMTRLSMTALRCRAARLVRWVRWYVREVSGEATYDKYVAHARACDPTTRVMTRREFERSRTDAREADPRDGFRCC